MRITIISITVILAILVTIVVGACNNNGICNAETESCLDCPSDCSCNFEGVKLDQWNCLPSGVGVGSCSKNSTSAVSFDLYDTGAGPLTALMTSYLRIPKQGDKTFKLVASNVGARVTINNETIIDSYFHQPVITSSRRVTLRSDLVHVIKVELFSVGNTKKLSLYWKDSDDYDAPFVAVSSMFFSNNVCGDGIPNTSGTACTERITVSQSAPSCGDGICMDPLPDNCFVDCHSHITRICSPLTTPTGHLPNSIASASDTLGKMIDNQVVWHLPGIEHLAYGLDIVSGDCQLSPLFYFGYCNPKIKNIVQDNYRDSIYAIPDELYAQPSPKCKFSITSTFFNSSVEIADSYATKSGVDVDVSASGTWRKITLSGSFAYSKEESVEKATELSQTRSGSLAVTEVSCEASKVQLNKINFHPNFLKDLASANTNADFLKLIKKYGTHYYKRATLGGRLRQVTTLDSSYERRASSSEISSNVEKTFSASLSAPAFEVDGDYSSSLDTTQTSESESEFQQNSFRSTVITYGGAPGSFGPVTSDAPSNFGDWASSIDLLPVPIDYQLESIASIIKDQWTTKNGTSVQAMWKAGENLYKNEIQELKASQGGPQTSRTYDLLWLYNVKSAEEINYKFPAYSLMVGTTSYPLMDVSSPGDLSPVILLGVHSPSVIYFPFIYSSNITNATTLMITSNATINQAMPDTSVEIQVDGTHFSKLYVFDNFRGLVFTADSNSIISVGEYNKPVWKNRIINQMFQISFNLNRVSGSALTSLAKNRQFANIVLLTDRASYADVIDLFEFFPKVGAVSSSNMHLANLTKIPILTNETITEIRIRLDARPAYPLPDNSFEITSLHLIQYRSVRINGVPQLTLGFYTQEDQVVRVQTGTTSFTRIPLVTSMLL